MPSSRGAPAADLRSSVSVTMPLAANGAGASSSQLGGAWEEDADSTAEVPVRADPWAAARGWRERLKAAGALGGLAGSLVGRGGHIESAGVNHRYSSEERARLRQFESIDYLAPSSRVYRQWLAAQRWGRDWDRWLMMMAIGLCVGMVAFFLHFLIHSFAAIKYHGTRWLLAHTNVVFGWLFNVSFSLGLVYASTWLVVNVAPEAAGGGVAEVTAYLNGCFIPAILNIKTFAVKFLSAACAVGSGLPVGPEGPMIHIGAIMGSGLSQGHSTTLGFDSQLFRRFRNPRDKREFVTAGAAVGVATAFSAPIGGLLFVWEEVASFWRQALGWQIFVAAMVGVLASDTMRSAEVALREGTFGVLDKDSSTVFFEVQTQLTNHVMAVLPAAVIGLICGLLGILFTTINVKVMRWRQAFFKGQDVSWRMMEPCAVIVVFVTLGMVLPLFFKCTPTQCVIVQGETTPMCPEGAPRDLTRVVEESMELYTCSTSQHHSQIPADWDPDGSGTKGNSTITIPKAYNELATLMSVPGEDTIRHLFSRGTHREFGYAAILLMLVLYFLGAAYTSGSAISSGTFVPMLLIGACIGRLVGLVTVDIAAHYGAGSEGAPRGVFLPPSPWAWIDPGAFALIGAGAFMGGVTRMTLALAVIMMEMSNDVRIILPAMVAIMLAKFVADGACHSLNHGLLDVKCVPFLPKTPHSAISLDLVEVRYVMHFPVVTLREQMRLGDVRDVLRRTRHNGFPVVRDTPEGGVCVGLVVRDHLLRLLVEAVKRGTCQHLEVSFAELNHRTQVDAGALQQETQQQLAVLEGRPLTPAHFPNDPGLWEEVLDLTPYINTSALRVPESFTLERSYILFSTLGLRHLTVVDEHNRVKGMVTRKDLLGYRLDDAVAHALTGSLATASAGSPHLTSSPSAGNGF